MELIVIFNPEAGSGEWRVKDVDRLLRDAGHRAEITKKKRKWRELLDETPDAFVAAGGDGTVHDLIHALEGRDVPVAILPLGTANNVAHSLGYRAYDSLEERAAGWTDNEKALTIAHVKSGTRERHFIESTGIGAFPDMLSHDDGKEWETAAPAALLAIRTALVRKLFAAEACKVGVVADGKCVEGDYVLVECLNLPYYGPGLCIAPRETAHEAMITVCGVPATARHEAAQWIASGEGNPLEWELGRGRSVELLVDRPVHVDGEVWRGKRKRVQPLNICAGARSVRILV